MAGLSEKFYNYADSRSTLLQPMLDLLMFTAFLYTYVYLINDVASIRIEWSEVINLAVRIVGPLLFKFCSSWYAAALFCA